MTGTQSGNPGRSGQEEANLYRSKPGGSQQPVADRDGLVNVPGDKSDIWPVSPEYFAEKYEVVGGLRADDLEPMTPDAIAWVRSQRETEVDDEACKVPGTAEGTCAYAGPDGKDACGPKCIFRGAALPCRACHYGHHLSCSGDECECRVCHV